MARFALAERLPPALALPNDLIYVVFSKLEFTDKIKAGLACKKWDQLLKTGSAAAKHWTVEYNLDVIMANSESAWRHRIFKVDEKEMTLTERCGCHVDLSHSGLITIPTQPHHKRYSSLLQLWADLVI
jgi:hypothetical protein